MHKAYLMNVKDLPIREALLLVPAWRREKAERLHFEADRRRSLGAWLLLIYALKKEGLSCGEVSFTQREKPYFADLSLPRFSLSHSGDYVMAAIADEEVGCDVQETVKADMRLANRVCTEREKESILSSEAPDRVFTSVWAKKEAILKCTGAGVAADFSSIESPSDPCFFIGGCAYYVCTKNGGFPQETAVVDAEDVLSFLRIG